MTSAGQPIRAIDTIGAVRVCLTGTQSIPNNSNTKILFNQVEYDDFGFWEASNSEIVIPEGMAGVYSIYSNASFASNATGNRGQDIESSKGRIASTWIDAGPIQNRLFSCVQDRFFPGDTIWAEAYQTSGGALNIEGSSISTTALAIVRMQPIE
jgi:hypothetical protein